MMRALPLAVAVVALSAMGCSDAPARPAKLGLYVNIRNPSDASIAGKQCGASSGIEWDIGKGIKDPMTGMIVDVDSPTPTDFGTTLEDGKSKANLDCTIRKSGAVTASGGGTDPVITPPNGSINFTISGTAKANGTPSTNTFNFGVYTPVTLSIASNQTLPPCAFTAVHEQAPGALWADFSCPALVKTGDPDVGCQATGTIVMEYCKTGEEE
jgi:hypothetical protein